MNRRAYLTLLASGALLALPACHVAPQLGHVAGTASAPGAQAAPRAFAGGVEFAVRWPARGVQTIPSTTDHITVSAFQLGQNSPCATTTLYNPFASSTSTATASLSPIAPGIVVLTATAYDVNNTSLAVGSTDVDIPTNGLVPATLVLASATSAPQILGIGPTSGMPGAEIVIYGNNFGQSSNAPFSVEFGNTPVANPVRPTDNVIDFALPGGVAPAAVSITVGGVTATSSVIVSPIASVSVNTTSATTFAPGGMVSFTVSAQDINGKSIAKPNVPFTLVNAASGFGTIGASGSFLSSYTYGTGDEVVGTGSIAATVSLTTHWVNQNDALAAGLMALPATDSYAGYYPASDPYYGPKVQLGETLFADTGFAGGPTKLSCASCHEAAFGMEAGRPTATLNTGAAGNRKPRTLLDVGFEGAGATGVTFPSSVFLDWDGRADNLEDQAQQELNDPSGIDQATASTLAYLAGSSAYQTAFTSAFGPGTPDDDCTGSNNDCISIKNAVEALATYERSLVTPQASFDQWISAPVGTNPNNALSTSAQIGVGLFIGYGHCAACHDGPDFTDDHFHNIGAASPVNVTDTGRAAISGNSADMNAFLTSSLRNIALRAPYYHAGLNITGVAVPDLTAAINYYEDVASHPGLDPELPVGFDVSENPTEQAALVAFLQSLTGATPSVLP